MKTPPPAAPAAGPPTCPPSAPPSSRPSKTPATCTSPKAGATTPPQPKPSTFTASIKTETDIHGTRRSPGLSPAMSIHLDERPVPMTRKAISTDAAPAALGPYSQAIVANGFVFCSGTAGIDPATGLPGDGIDAQTELELHNLQAILTATGQPRSTLAQPTI